uniref:Uncharacterized protein n=1 Tax=Cajanus cajan TaxID=3821 RepID=A0A151QN32_CAJCA|nr:hypothetical protein KK1_047858 [Cajanus cajan]
MKRSGVTPNNSTFPFVAKACATLSHLRNSQLIHAHVLKSCFQSNIFVQTAMVDMYVKCGQLEDAHNVFVEMPVRDIASWNAMLLGFAHGGFLHRLSFQLGCDSDVCVVNTLICMYSKCGDVHSARFLFDGMYNKTYLVTVLALISGCGQMGALELGKWIDNYTINKGLKDNVVVCNALIDMYAKCGSFKGAKELFYTMANRSLVTWTTMITACALNGDVKDALDLFFMMLEMGTKPNRITFLAVLQACAHGGLLERGLDCFNMMAQKYGISPGIDHYSCMVDLLGRRGHLVEALEIIKSMPFEPDAGIWSALLSACKLRGNMEIGRYVSEKLFELEPQVAVPFVEMANIYASAEMWDGVAAIRRKMKYLQVRKFPGQSIIQVNGKSTIFTVEDRDHPETLYIYDMLDGLTSHSKNGLLALSEETVDCERE